MRCPLDKVSWFYFKKVTKDRLLSRFRDNQNLRSKTNI